MQRNMFSAFVNSYNSVLVNPWTLGNWGKYFCDSQVYSTMPGSIKVRSLSKYFLELLLCSSTLLGARSRWEKRNGIYSHGALALMEESDTDKGRKSGQHWQWKRWPLFQALWHLLGILWKIQERKTKTPSAEKQKTLNWRLPMASFSCQSPSCFQSISHAGAKSWAQRHYFGEV